jgi:hypothetical protein
MGRLIPDNFLTIRQAADEFAVAMYSGLADRPFIEQHRRFDVADGAAVEEAISKIWAAVDRGTLQAFAVGPSCWNPLKLSARMSQAIPLLRSPRGGDLSFLRPGNPHYNQLAAWLGRDLAKATVVFRVLDITRETRKLLRSRRRRTASTGTTKAGRPSRQIEVKKIIPEVIDKRRWSPTQSLKALTKAVNDRANWQRPVSKDTVTRALSELHSETGDRRFARVHRG